MHCTCRENEKEEYLEEFDQVSFDVHKFYLPMPTLKDSNGASLSLLINNKFLFELLNKKCKIWIQILK